MFAGPIFPAPSVNLNLASKSVFISPSPINLPTPTPSPTPSQVPSPTATPTLVPKPTTETNPAEEKFISPTPIAPTSDIGQNLLNQINNFRSSNGLAPFTTDGYTCAFASLRATEVAGDFNHNGFNDRVNAKTLPYPSYSSVAENIAQYPTPDGVVQGWIDSPGHNENLRKDAPYACVGKNGEYYVFEAWKP